LVSIKELMKVLQSRLHNLQTIETKLNKLLADTFTPLFCFKMVEFIKQVNQETLILKNFKYKLVLMKFRIFIEIIFNVLKPKNVLLLLALMVI
jgi:hypothetical protein